MLEWITVSLRNWTEGRNCHIWNDRQLLKVNWKLTVGVRFSPRFTTWVILLPEKINYFRNAWKNSQHWADHCFIDDRKSILCIQVSINCPTRVCATISKIQFLNIKILEITFINLKQFEQYIDFSWAYRVTDYLNQVREQWKELNQTTMSFVYDLYRHRNSYLINSLDSLTKLFI